MEHRASYHDGALAWRCVFSRVLLPCCRVKPSPVDSGLTTGSCSSVASEGHPEVKVILYRIYIYHKII